MIPIPLPLSTVAQNQSCVRAKLGEMTMFKNQISMDFSGVSMKNKSLTQDEKTENKMIKMLRKNSYKHSLKIENNIETIKQLVNEIDENTILKIISKAFDSPNIINALAPQIKEIYISTWAITPAGIGALVNMIQSYQIEKAFLLLDLTHSYKWIFTSGAYKILKGKVNIHFAGNHSKFVCIKTETGYINFIGSMNLSNNPRFENIEINKLKDDFEFYSSFIINIKSKEI